MNSVSIDEFKDKLNDCIEKVTHRPQPLKVRCRDGKDFVVLSVEDWEQEQETF